MKNRYLKINSWISKYLEKYRLLYPVSFILILLACFLFMLNLGGLSLMNKYVFYVLEFLLILFSGNLLFYKALKEGKLEYIYLSLMIPIGISYLVFIIPNQPYDESAHVYRVYELSVGKFITTSDEDNKAVMNVPQNLIDTIEVKSYKELVENIQTNSNYKNTVELSSDATGAASYTIFSYFSPTIGMFVGRSLDLNITLTYYLARIFSFITFLILTFYSIKIIPFGKLIFFILSFNPIWIQQGTAITADTMINSFTFLLLSFIFYLYNKKEKITNKEINIYGLLAIAISFMKMVYFPLSALGLLLFSKIKDKKQKKKIIIIIILTVIFALLNYIMSNQYTFPKSHQLEYGIDSMKQLSWILNHPISYVKVLLNTFITNGEFYLYTMLGRNLGSFTIFVPNIVIIIYSYLCLLSPFLEENKITLNKYHKLIIFLIIIIIYLLVETALYMTWTGVGASIIDGVQGRYFHPILLLLPFLFVNKNNKIIIKNKNLKITILLICINTVVLYTIIKTFNY